MKVYTTLAAALIAATGVGAGGTALAAEQIGVTKTEIVVGTIQDLSGPLAGFGKLTSRARYDRKLTLARLVAAWAKGATPRPRAAPTTATVCASARRSPISSCALCLQASASTPIPAAL